MFRFNRLTLVTLVFLAIASVRPVTATSNLPVPQAETPESAPTASLACDPDGVQESGAVYRICMPTTIPWNGDLLVYVHGYVSPTEPVGILEDQMTLPGTGMTIDQLANSMGYAFATTSYSTNGLAVLEGIADLVDLVDIFTAEKGAPNNIYLIGVSEGGLITTLAVEWHPDVFDGGLALCGPYGDFGYQINYFGDLRVVFDYFFPDLMPDSPLDIPDWLIEEWDTYYETTIKPEIEDPANAGLVEQLLNVTNAPYDTEDPSTKEDTIHGLLWYNVFATNDGIDKLGGQPFDNQVESTPAPTTTPSSTKGCSALAPTKPLSTRLPPTTRPLATSACPWSLYTPPATRSSPTGTPPAIAARPSPPIISPSTSTLKLTAMVIATSHSPKCSPPSTAW